MTSRRSSILSLPVTPATWRVGPHRARARSKRVQGLTWLDEHAHQWKNPRTLHKKRDLLAACRHATHRPHNQRACRDEPTCAITAASTAGAGAPSLPHTPAGLGIMLCCLHARNFTQRPPTPRPRCRLPTQTSHGCRTPRRLLTLGNRRRPAPSSSPCRTTGRASGSGR